MAGPLDAEAWASAYDNEAAEATAYPNCGVAMGDGRVAAVCLAVRRDVVAVAVAAVCHVVRRAAVAVAVAVVCLAVRRVAVASAVVMAVVAAFHYRRRGGAAVDG